MLTEFHFSIIANYRRKYMRMRRLATPGKLHFTIFRVNFLLLKKNIGLLAQ